MGESVLTLLMGEGKSVRDLVSNGSPGRGDVEGDMGVDEGVIFVIVIWEGAAGAGAGGGVAVREEEASARAGGHESVRCVSCTPRALSTAAATTLSYVL